MLTLIVVLVAAGATPDASGLWALRTIADPRPPEVRDLCWVRNDIDRFILARLEAQRLAPAPPADKPTLLRRVSFDLTGLPPGEDEIRAFLKDERPDAFERVVERLLASPRYGERWGRHWLDVARYADSTGSDEDHRYPYAYRYRDYVIAAFNDDVPYNQFVREQIAGDLLPRPGAQVNRRGIVATGFLALGPKALAQQDRTKMLYDIYDEQLDTTSKAFMGLTIACARCHDHKFDPISSRDYYSIVGIFARTRSVEDATPPLATLHLSPLAPAPVVERHRKHERRVAYLKAEIDALIDEAVARRQAQLTAEISRYMLAAHAVHEEGRAVDAEACGKGLEPRRLQKWVDYLRPRDAARPHLQEWYEAPPVTRETVALRYQEGFARALAAWREKLARRREATSKRKTTMELPPPPRPELLAGEDRFFYDVAFRDSGPFFFEEKDGEKTLGAESRRRLARLRRDVRRLEEVAPPVPELACAVAEGEAVEQKVFRRGDPRRPGETVPRGFPAVFGERGVVMPPGGSGRLELADWLTRSDHPLTARVMVNRIWQWHFGEGIVRTPNNWGRTGEPPTHPELLDYLARRFIESGWSVKAMHRLLLGSNTYRMAARLDPENGLLSHFNRRRLDVEEIRDALLLVDGSLDLTMGGTLDPAAGGDLETSAKRLSLSPESVRRRSVYLPLRPRQSTLALRSFRLR